MTAVDYEEFFENIGYANILDARRNANCTASKFERSNSEI
jgi:hypothetical protein